jgi:hypothetical protein
MKEVIIQLSSRADNEKLCSIEGNAIFTADTKKVPIKDVIATTSSID